MKKIFCIIFSLLILISISIITVSADDTTHGGSSGSIDDNTGTLEGVNVWSYKDWEPYLSDIDLTSKDYSWISDIEDYDYNFLCINTSLAQGNSSYLTSYYLNASDLNYMVYNTSGFLVSNNEFSGDYYCFNNSTIHNDVKSSVNNNIYENGYVSMIGISYSDTLNQVNNSYIWLVSDLNIYNSIVEAYPNWADQIYYCSDPTKSFIDYLNASLYDDMFYDVYPMASGSKHIIRFYDCFDSYYGKYQYDFYEDNMLNYLNSSYSLNTELYCKPSKISTGNQIEAGDLQHNEMYNIYIPVPDDFEVDNANAYLSSIGQAIHYEKGNIDFGTWYSTYIKPWLDKYNASSKFTVITLKDVEPSTKEYPTVNTSDTKKDIKLLKLLFPSYYTFVESTEADGGMIMSGCRTMSTASIVDIANGTIENSASNGIGADIDGGDYVDDKDYDELIADGWKKGYPNTASYPYKITVNKSGSVLYEFYFDMKPQNIVANYYSDSQICYDIDFNLTRGYIYAKQKNCHLPFNFRSEQEHDWMTSDGTVVDQITDDEEFRDMLLRIGLTSVSPVIGGVVANETIEARDNYKLPLRLWTNYTGQLHGTYRGYYVQFNWDLELDDNFIKNNSDDTHNYTDDYLQDDGFTDNNGNIHGGAVDIYPTNPGEDFDFNSEFEFNTDTLTDMSSTFFKLLKNVFGVFPEWIWALIFIAFSIIIACRLLGR